MVQTGNKDTGSYLHILKYTGVFGGVQGLSILISLIRTKLVVTILGANGVGLISLFNSSVKLVSDSTNLGIGMSAVKRLSEAYDQGDAEATRQAVGVIRAWGFFTALLGTVVFALMSPLLNRWTFDWGNHTMHFVFLSPLVGLLALIACELAVLKGVRQLRALTITSVYNVILVLLVTVPLYYFFGEAAVVPSLVLASAVQLLLVCYFSLRLFPLRLCAWSLTGWRSRLSQGFGMVRLGVAFVMAGVLGSGADFVIRSYLNQVGGLDVVGFYNAGYMMTMTFSGLVFSSMEADFFPRLSGFSQLGADFNTCVNKQIEVSLLLVAPMVVCFMVAMPVIVPLLYSSEFGVTVGMVQVMALSIYMRAIKLPIAYIPLARGDSRSYLFLEGVYDIVVVIAVLFCYHLWHLVGAGIALAATSLFDLVLLWIYTRYRYGYQFSEQVVRCAFLLLPMGILAFVVTQVCTGWLYWLLGTILFVVSSVVSLIILRKKTHLWESLTRKLRSRWQK